MTRGWVALIGPGSMTALTRQRLNIEFRIVLVLLYLVVFVDALYRSLTYKIAISIFESSSLPCSRKRFNRSIGDHEFNLVRMRFAQPPIKSPPTDTLRPKDCHRPHRRPPNLSRLPLHMTAVKVTHRASHSVRNPNMLMVMKTAVRLLVATMILGTHSLTQAQIVYQPALARR